VPTPHSDYYAHTLEIDFLCFSSGGEDPLAGEPTRIVKHVSGTELIEMDMEICVGLSAVLLTGSDNVLLVFDWKRAQNIVVSVIGIGDLLA